MKFSLKWLRDYVDIDASPAEFAARMTDATAEVEQWTTVGGEWDRERIRVAAVLDVEPHPNADTLRLATVDAGEGPRQVVCGAPNIAAGQKVAFATAGAELFDGHTGKPAVLKPRAIRGVESAGMVLSERELGLSDAHEGILVLPEDTRPGTPLVDAIGDVIFDISTWANRGDLLGVLGMAREVAAVYGRPLREPDRAYGESRTSADEVVTVEVADPDLCRRFTASVVTGVQHGPSPEWMQERLRAAGMRPINNLVDVTNYVMLETGQPLHAFDYDLVRGKKIVARRARPGERLVTLDGVDRELDPDMLMICDAEGPVGVAGIMGGGNSEVSESTKTILLEVANFHPGSIRRTSTMLKLRSEASLRFEKGLGPELADYARRRALHLYEQVASGKVAAGVVDVYPGKKIPAAIHLADARIAQVLGIEVPAEEVTRILESLGFLVEVADGGYTVIPPFWRVDVNLPDDVIEEIIRVYGYDKLPATSLRGALPEPESRPVEDVRRHLRDQFAALGFQEIINYTLTSMEEIARVVPADDTRRRTPLGVMNPVAAQHTYLRTTLRHALLRNYAANRGHHDGPLRLFEAGFEYLPRESDLPHERPVLCGMVGGPREGRWHRATGDSLDFFDAKGVVEVSLASLGVRTGYRAAEHHGLLAGHTADVLAGSDVLGVVAQVHPTVAAEFGIDEPVFLVELWIEEIAPHVPERPAYEPPSRFPEVRHDLAFIVDESTPAAELVDRIRVHRSGGVRLRADVFDEYRGPGIPAGKKSLAVAVRYQADDRTLTEKDIEKVQSGLLVRLQKETGASLRA